MAGKVKLNVDLYKPSGKWGYGFQVWIDVPDGYITDSDLLEVISLQQKEISPSTITGGSPGL
jgi:hypothetical protein